jgi:predicted phage gp36 major capsid-like protein
LSQASRLNPETRRLNHQRAEDLRKLAAQAKQAETDTMKKIWKAICLTADELDVVVAERETEALGMQPGTGRQSALMDVQQLRYYAAMKRLLLLPPALEPLQAKASASKRLARPPAGHRV